MTAATEEPLLEHSLTVSFVLYLEGRGNEARDLAQKMASDSWVARCISFLCDAWLLFEPSRAADVFGGIEVWQILWESGGIEKHFVAGHVALLRREIGTAISEFRAALLLAPKDPYVLVSLALACSMYGQREEAADVFGAVKASRPNHPVVRAFQFGDSRA